MRAGADHELPLHVQLQLKPECDGIADASIISAEHELPAAGLKGCGGVWCVKVEFKSQLRRCQGDPLAAVAGCVFRCR